MSIFARKRERAAMPPLLRIELSPSEWCDGCCRVRGEFVKVRGEFYVTATGLLLCRDCAKSSGLSDADLAAAPFLPAVRS